MYRRFELATPVTMGLVCFRLKGHSNALNERLNQMINEEGKIHLTPSQIGDGLYILRLAICSR